MNINTPGRSLHLPWKKRPPPPASPHQDGASTAAPSSRRLRMLNWMPMSAKNHLVAMLSEFVGTFMFLLFAFGGTNVVNGATRGGKPLDPGPDPARLLYISLCFGMSLAVNAWVFFRISGGLFNPAVTLGMVLIGAVGYLRGALVFIAQLLGGIASAAVVLAIFPGGLNIRTSLGGGTSIAQGLFIEMFLTAQLVFTIFMLAAEKHRATFIAPVGIGLSLFIAELMGVYYTGGSLNPARSFGPAVVLGSFYPYHWIYWLGPILGSLLATGFYLLVKALEYETVNPQQDDTGRQAHIFDPNTGEEKSIKGDDVAIVLPSSPGSTPAAYESPEAARDAESPDDVGEGSRSGGRYRSEAGSGRGRSYQNGPDMEAGGR